MRKLRLAAILLGLTALITSSAFAQQTTGNITGRVVDAQGAAVPGATVTGTQHGDRLYPHVVSDAEGIYRLPALPVGIYDLIDEASGFTDGRAEGHRRSTSARRSTST